VYIEISQGNALCNYIYLKQARISVFLLFFYKMGEQEGGTGLPQHGGVGTTGRG
jgi:hypothetical protein